MRFIAVEAKTSVKVKVRARAPALAHHVWLMARVAISRQWRTPLSAWYAVLRVSAPSTCSFEQYTAQSASWANNCPWNCSVAGWLLSIHGSLVGNSQAQLLFFTCLNLCALWRKERPSPVRSLAETCIINLLPTCAIVYAPRRPAVTCLVQGECKGLSRQRRAQWELPSPTLSPA